MNRREFLKKAGLGTVALASLPTLGPVLINSLATPALASDQTNFTFVVVSKLVGGPDLLILNGSGKFGSGEVNGGGSFTHVNPGTGVIVASGTWRAKKLVSFTPNGTFGAHASGILEMKSRLLPTGGERVEGVVMRQVCNLPGLDTGQEEGVTVTLPNGATFEPTDTGATLFSTGNENRG